MSVHGSGSLLAFCLCRCVWGQVLPLAYFIWLKMIESISPKSVFRLSEAGLGRKRQIQSLSEIASSAMGKRQYLTLFHGLFHGILFHL